MDPKELLLALMKRDGDNPNSLAGKLKQKTKQPQIHKFVKGTAKEPKRSTLEPVADHYGISVEAFYDANLAGEIHENLIAGRPLMPAVTASIQSSQAQSVRMVATVGPSLGETLKCLSGYLGVLDARSRGRVGQLLKDFAEEPDAHERITTIFQAELDSGKLKRA